MSSHLNKNIINRVQIVQLDVNYLVLHTRQRRVNGFNLRLTVIQHKRTPIETKPFTLFGNRSTPSVFAHLIARRIHRAMYLMRYSSQFNVFFRTYRRKLYVCMVDIDRG